MLYFSLKFPQQSLNKLPGMRRCGLSVSLDYKPMSTGIRSIFFTASSALSTVPGTEQVFKKYFLRITQYQWLPRRWLSLKTGLGSSLSLPAQVQIRETSITWSPDRFLSIAFSLRNGRTKKEQWPCSTGCPRSALHRGLSLCFNSGKRK